MKSLIAENEAKTRRAVVNGKQVTFYLRQRKDGNNALYPWWRETFADHDAAAQAAGRWAVEGKLNRQPQRAVSDPAFFIQDGDHYLPANKIATTLAAQLSKMKLDDVDLLAIKSKGFRVTKPNGEPISTEVMA